MAAVAVAPFVLKDTVFTVGTDQFEAHCSQIEFTPSTSTLQWQGLTPAASFTDSSSPSWSATLSVAQDWTTPGSLSQYLFQHQGETISATFVTNDGAGTWAADLIIAPGAVGGQVNAYAVATVSLGVSGQPTFTPPVAADEARRDVNGTDDVADPDDFADPDDPDDTVVSVP
jgi:hypothetical protein